MVNENLVATSLDAQNFFNENQASVVGKIIDAKLQLNQFYELANELKNIVLGNLDDMTIVKSQIKLLSESIDPELGYNADQQLEYDNLSNLYVDLLKDNDEIIMDWKAERLENLWLSYQSLLGITSSNEVFNNNNIIFYRSLLKKILQNGHIGDAEMNDLDFLSNLCPLESGGIVFKANSILSKSIMYNPNSSCQLPLERKILLDEGDTNIVLSPNPVKSQITIKVPTSQPGIVRYAIFETGGTLLQNEDIIESHNIQISVENLESGIYFLKTLDVLLNRHVEKFIKINYLKERAGIPVRLFLIF